ncbi:AmmeMemoRadiSam system protein B [Paucibacter soli]|uniref:AmmeMemoRadiSam system protein B n=1 Tax=Paucibacter soli TaxID=3133433 RepID=UPI0030A0B59C
MPVAATRPAAVACSFYPARPEALARELDGYLDAVPAAQEAQPPKLLVVPHAGYRYSGPVAAHAYALLRPWREQIRRVVLLGPAHRVALRGLGLPEAQRSFATPLGEVLLDQAASAQLSALPQVSRDAAAHAFEHSLEVQLPFLQRLLGDFSLVPLVVGEASAAEVAEALELLWGGDETLIVISSDLSHYLPYAQAQALDRDTVRQLLALEQAPTHAQACGATPLAGAMLAARAHGLAGRLLDLRNSGDTAGDKSRVVGYAALAYAAPGDLGQTLLARARNAIAGELGLPLRAEPWHPRLERPGACFVTLHAHGSLRGCIGNLEADEALKQALPARARAAAFEDPRFAPLTASEWPHLDIEISLLSPAEPMPARSLEQACAQLRPGVDGLVLSWRGRRATFLPQVWAQLPLPLDFLRALRQKAGLAADFWAEDLQLARYQVQRFSEVQQ